MPVREAVTCGSRNYKTEDFIVTLLFGSEVPRGLLSLCLDSGPKCQLKASFSSFAVLF